MRGTIVTRNGHHSIVLDRGKDPITGKRRQQWIAVKGNKQEAEAQLNDMVHDQQHGSFVKPTKLTVRDHLVSWMDNMTPNWAPTTDETYRFIAKKHILPALGNQILSELQPQTVQKLYSEKSKSGLSASTVIKIHNILHGSLENAVKTCLIKRNPLDFVKRPSEDWREMKTMSVVDIHLLLDNAHTTIPSYYPIFYTEIFTGLRRGETLAIKWGDVNLDLLKISISHSLCYLKVPINGSHIFLKKTKNKKSKRFISITPSNAVVLREYYDKQNEERKSLGLPLLQDDDYVFCGIDGKPFLPNSVTHVWIKLTRRVGLPGIRLHDCRHTYATQLLAQNVHPAIVANQLGHSTVRTTIDRYSHIIPGLQEAAAIKFDDIVMGTNQNLQRMPAKTGE